MLPTKCKRKMGLSDTPKKSLIPPVPAKSVLEMQNGSCGWMLGGILPLVLKRGIGVRVKGVAGSDAIVAQ